MKGFTHFACRSSENKNSILIFFRKNRKTWGKEVKEKNGEEAKKKKKEKVKNDNDYSFHYFNIIYKFFFLLFLSTPNMSSKDYAHLQDLVPQLVLDYQITSKSRKLSKVAPQNTDKIIKSINRDVSKKKHFFDLVSKKDHCLLKVYRFIQETAPNDDEYVPEVASHDSKLDPRYISNRFLGEKYIRQDVLHNESKRKSLKEIVNKHYDFQTRMKIEREQLLQKFENGKRSETNNASIKLRKLSGVNSDIMNNKLEKMDSDFQEELRKFDEYVYYKMKNLSKESSTLLIRLNIPFFSISTDYEYPRLQKDKEFIVNYINNVMNKEGHQVEK